MGELKYSILDMVETEETPSRAPLLAANAAAESSPVPPQREALDVPVATATPMSDDDNNNNNNDDDNNNNDDDSIPTLVTTTPSPDPADLQQHDNSRMASGGASGVVGCLVGGPLVGLALGFGAIYAHDRQGVVGDASRALGEIALQVNQRARRINEQHHVVATTKAAAVRVVEQAKTYEQHNHVVEQAQHVIVQGWNWTVEFVKKHNLIERGVQSVGKGVVWVAEAIASKIHALADQQDHSTVQPAEARVVTEEVVSK